jgi:hypothetical protein
MSGSAVYGVGRLEEMARKAAAQGTEEGNNLARYINNLSSGALYRLENQLSRSAEERRQAYSQSVIEREAQEQVMLDGLGSQAGALWKKPKAQQALREHLGISDSMSIPDAIDFYASRYGPRATSRIINQIEIQFGS